MAHVFSYLLAVMCTFKVRFVEKRGPRCLMAVTFRCDLQSAVRKQLGENVVLQCIFKAYIAFLYSLAPLALLKRVSPM